MSRLLHYQGLGKRLAVLLTLGLLGLVTGNAAGQAQQPATGKYKNVEEAYRAGNAYLTLKDLENGQKTLEQALQLAPSDQWKMKIYGSLRPAYRSLPEIDKMVEAAEFIISHSDKPAERYLTRADLLSFVHQRGKVSDLVSRYEMRLKQTPDDKTALYLLSELYDRWASNPRRGIEVSERLLAILQKEEGKLDVRTATQLAKHYVHAGKWQDGAKLYEKIAPLDARQTAWHWKAAAQAWLKAKEKEKALKAAKTAVAGPPEKRTQGLTYFWHKGLADVFLETGEAKLAIEHYEKALEHTTIEGYRRTCLERLAEARRQAKEKEKE